MRPVSRDLSKTAALWLACCGPAATPAPEATPAAPAAAQQSHDVGNVEAAGAAEADAAEARRLAELPHRVVFADRITYSYVLLLPGDGVAAPTREELDAAVRKAFPDNLEDEEVQLLLGLVARPIREFGAPPTEAEELEEGAEDLLGFAVEAHPRRPTSGPALLETKVLADPDLTRELTPEERASLPARGSLLVLRAQYRNQHGVRGLRLLQTLVRVVATQRGALIHDPDTLETHGPAAFAARRLQTSLGNVADQIPVVPFPDPRHTGRFRLATRGMRRFGSVDLELDGLPGELPTLQLGTFFLHGLTRVMIDLGEFESGFAAELPQTLTLHHSDCAAAYAGRPGSLPRCKDCPESVDLHLVERAAEPQDAISHVVARVVAPRPRSDQSVYDHPQWVQEAITRVLGAPVSGGPAPM